MCDCFLCQHSTLLAFVVTITPSIVVGWLVTELIHWQLGLVVGLACFFLLLNTITLGSKRRYTDHTNTDTNTKDKP